MLKERIPFFLHPLPIFAVLLMGINDHLLKYKFPGWVTGKLSDFCGVFYLPLFLAALVILCRSSSRGLTRFLLISMIVVTDTLMIATKLVPSLNEFVVFYFSTYLFPIRIVQDPGDLIALTMNVPTYIFGRRYFTDSAFFKKSL